MRKLLVGGVVGLLIGGLIPGCGNDDTSPLPTSPTTTGGNRAPEAVGIIPPQNMPEDGETLVSVALYFRDPDGDPLTYAAMSSDPDTLTATVSGSLVTLTARRARDAAISVTVTVTATDPGNLTATQTLSFRARPPGLLYRVWSKNGFDGESYEYAVICEGDYAVLESCFLSGFTAVRVEAPDGRIFELEKDFNIQGFSGEVTRRWVLYGPAGAGFPTSGDYIFRFYTGVTLEHEESVPYTLRTVGFPTDVVARREGNDLVVEWTQPSDGAPSMLGKVLLFPDGGEIISQVYNWGTRSARLPDIPLSDGIPTLVNVMLAFYEAPAGGGYAYSEYVRLVW